MAKNLSIVAEGISGDEGKLLGYNVTDNGIYTPAIGDVARDTTATYVAQDGTIKTAQPNVARVDYTNGVAELLLEPESTNLIPYSEKFNSSKWLSQGGTISDGGSLDGYNSVIKYVSDEGSNFQQIYSLGSQQAPIGAYSQSTMFKAVGFSYLWIKNDLLDSAFLCYDLINKTIISQDSNYDSANIKFTEKPNGWIKLEISFTSLKVTDLILPQLYVSASSSSPFENVNSATIYETMAQVEQLTYPTSYIPTNGAIATRGADSMTNFGSEQIIDSESGILFFEGSKSTDVGYLNLVGETTNDKVQYNLQSNGYLQYRISTGGVSVYSYQSSDYRMQVNENIKIAIKYKVGSTAQAYYNGIEINSDIFDSVAGSTPLKEFKFASPNGSTAFYGRVRQVKHLPYNTDITTL